MINVEGHQLGIFNVQGTFVTILNICPHEQAPICCGHIDGTTLSSSPGEFRWGREGEILRCPWHGWEFDLLTGKALVDKRRLRRYPTVVENEDIYVIL